MTCRYGVQIDQYMSDLTYASQMDCACARDAADDLTTLSCSSFTGGYDEVQVGPDAFAAQRS